MIDNTVYLEIKKIKNELWIKINNKWVLYSDVNIVNKKIHQGYKKYYTHFNGGRPLLVCIKNNIVKIYIHNRSYDYSIIDYNYNILIKQYTAKKIFLGKHYDTDYKGTYYIHKPKYDGNSILLYLGDNTYSYIGDQIYEFTTKDDDKIIEYHSIIGNSDVSYPVAVGEKNIYFMLDKKYIPIKYFNNIKKKDLIIGYQYYYSQYGNEPEALEKYAKKMKHLKKIKKHIFDIY